MKQYKKFGVRLSLDASAWIEDVSKHTGIAGAEGNPKTGRCWCDRVKESVGDVIRNWWLLVFVWDKFFGM